MYDTLNGYVLFNMYLIIIYFGEINSETNIHYRKASMSSYFILYSGIESYSVASKPRLFLADLPEYLSYYEQCNIEF